MSDPSLDQTKDQPLVIALSKGRILTETLPLLAAAGIQPTEDMNKSRKLIFDTNLENVKLLLVRATDAPTYVEYGVADMGVSGKDVLMEHGSRDMFEVLDLNISKCRLMTAELREPNPVSDRLKVATKFVNVARRYYAEQGRQVDIIKLYGGQELAPIMGLADVIVDIVDTGNTLVANGLEPKELIAHISSRLVVNRSSMKLKQHQLQPIIDKMKQAVEQGKAA